MEKTAILELHVTPRGSKNEIIGWKNEILWLKITAPPVDGSANTAIIKLLATALKVKKSAITIISGEKSREKRLKIENINLDEIHKIINIYQQ